MKRIAIFTLISVLFTGLVAGETLPQGEKEGYLLRVTGEVQVERNEETTVAQTRMEILGGDLIVTGAGGEAVEPAVAAVDRDDANDGDDHRHNQRQPDQAQQQLPPWQCCSPRTPPRRRTRLPDREQGGSRRLS